MKTIEVNADALSQLLQAVCGPNNYIRELQVTRRIDPNNPIDVLLAEYEAAKGERNNES